MRVITFLLATAIAAPACFAQEAGGEVGPVGSPTCSLLAELDEADARLFMQGYLAGRRDAFGVLPAGAGAAMNEAEIEAGPSGAASPVGSPAEPAPASPDQAPADTAAGSDDADSASGAGAEPMAFSLTSLDALVDSAVTHCGTDPARQLIEVTEEADPRDPMGTEPGLAGAGAPKPD